MIRMLAVVAAIALAAILALAAFEPDEFRVQRSTTINAPAAKVFPLIDDFRRWTAWSPFEKMDPTMRRTYGATTAGKGATYAWEGDGKAGAGRMEIAESTAPSRVGIVLDFEKPIANRARTTFTLSPHGDATLVTWTMESPNRYLVKVMHLFFDAEQIVGDDFARGLADLKAAAEKS
ncbi:MAG TPA: SRPBCC family protein [Casimicrobiaceae bacterium]|jgi:uncharacterized protein YndB with AHSA1/START domain|nr:SRPBCC family protein [Casimicrobiaceae bacterium]